MHLILCRLNIPTTTWTKHAKVVRNITDEIDFDKELQVFLGSKSDVWEYLFSLPQMENAQYLYPNFSFGIVIVFTVVQVQVHVCIDYRDSSNFTITQL